MDIGVESEDQTATGVQVQDHDLHTAPMAIPVLIDVPVAIPVHK